MLTGRPLLRLGGRKHALWNRYVHFYQPSGYRVASKSGNIVNGQFVHESLPVPLHGLDTNAELGGDLFVAFTFSD